MARYELVEGTSSKFWEIELSGSSFATTWGRIGTAGQTATKSWADAAQAKKEHDKLVAEKVRKGYALAGAAATSPPTPKAAPKPKPKAADAEPPPPPEPSTPAAPVPYAGERAIDLDPDDWRVAVWRERPDAPRAEPRPFDVQRCVAALGKVRVATYGHGVVGERPGQVAHGLDEPSAPSP